MIARPVFHVLSTFCLVLLAACASDGSSSEAPGPEPTPQPEPAPEPAEGSFLLEVSSIKVPIVQGNTVELTVKAVRKNGFDGAIDLSAVSLPKGASMKRAEIAADEDETTIELSAADDAPHSLPSKVEIHGESSNLEANTPITVTVCGHPGALDTSFQDGRVIVPVGAGDDYANAMALTADEKILVAGRIAENYSDFGLIRLERDGSLDTSFGKGGKVSTPIGERGDVAYAIAVQEDGKVVLAGSSENLDSGLDFALARYLPDGSLDEDFGNGGTITTSVSADSDTAYALLVQRDGKIVVAGESNQGASQTGGDFAVVRFTSDGQLDEAFGDEGVVLTPVASGGGRDVAYSLASQDIDGEERLIVAGGEGDFAIARYTSDGELDVDFGEGGKVSRVFGSVIGAARALTVTEDNRILVAGNNSHDFSLIRLTESGEFDAKFGDGGKVVTAVSKDNWDEAQSLAVDADGNIVVGGWAYEGSGSSGNFALVRYTDTGELDAAFGDGGIVVTQVAGSTKNDLGNAVLLQADDRIPSVRVLMAGSANGSNHDFAVTRYWR
jgi:uncharacterized delta-60 repeat protein